MLNTLFEVEMKIVSGVNCDNHNTNYVGNYIYLTLTPENDFMLWRENQHEYLSLNISKSLMLNLTSLATNLIKRSKKGPE